MHPGNRYNSHTRLDLWNIRDNKKICAHNYSRTAVYSERFSVVLGPFPKASCAKYFLVTKARILDKTSLNFGPWNFQHLRN